MRIGKPRRILLQSNMCQPKSGTICCSRILSFFTLQNVCTPPNCCTFQEACRWQRLCKSPHRFCPQTLCIQYAAKSMPAGEFASMYGTPASRMALQGATPTVLYYRRHSSAQQTITVYVEMWLDYISCNANLIYSRTGHPPAPQEIKAPGGGGGGGSSPGLC